MTATITGARRTRDAVVSLSARDLVVEQISIGTLTANGRAALVDDGLIAVEAAAPTIGAHTRLEIVNRAGYPVSGDITVEHEQIGTLIPPRYLRQIGDVSGALSATATGSGHLSDPAGIRGRVDLRVLDLTARGTHVVLAAPGSLTLAEDRIAVDSVDLRIGERTRATIEGQLGVTVLPQPLRLRVDGPLSELIGIGSRTAGVAPASMRTEGTAMPHVTAGGTFSHPLPTGSLAVRASSIQYGSLAPMTDLRIDAAIDPTVITLPTLAAQWQGATLGGNGTLPWRVVVSALQNQPGPGRLQSSPLAPWLNGLPAEPARATLTLRADNVTPSVLQDVLPAERLQLIEGNASATIAAEADGLSLERVRGEAVLDRASLVVAGVPLNQRVPTRLRLENGRASIDAFEWN